MKKIEGEFTIERWQVTYQPRQMLDLPAGAHIMDVAADYSSQPYLVLASPLRASKPPPPERRILHVLRPFDCIPTKAPVEYVGKFSAKDSWEVFFVWAEVL